MYKNMKKNSDIKTSCIMSGQDLFWDIEMSGQEHSGDTTWLAPTADDDFCGRDAGYCKEYALPESNRELIKDRGTIDISITPIRGDSGVLDIIGGELWEACFYLCAYILQHPDLFINSSVLELGAGLGLPGLLVSQLKSVHREAPPRQAEVCLSDKALELLEHLSATVVGSLGGIRLDSSPGEKSATSSLSRTFHTPSGTRVAVQHLDWQAYVDISDCDWTLKPRYPEALLDNRKWEVLIGSALVYSSSHSSVAFVLRHFLASPNCREVVIIQIRDRPGFSNFLLMLDSLGLIYSVDSIDNTLRAVAMGIVVQSNPLKPMEKIFKFPITQMDKPASTIMTPLVGEMQSGATPTACTKDSESCRSFLTTDPAAFALLRISKKP